MSTETVGQLLKSPMAKMKRKKPSAPNLNPLSRRLGVPSMPQDNGPGGPVKASLVRRLKRSQVRRRTF